MRYRATVRISVGSFAVRAGNAFPNDQFDGAGISLVVIEMAANHVVTVAAGTGIELHIGGGKKRWSPIGPGLAGLVDGAPGEPIVGRGAPRLAGGHSGVAAGIAVAVRIGVRPQITLGEDWIIGADRKIKS